MNDMKSEIIIACIQRQQKYEKLNQLGQTCELTLDISNASDKIKETLKVTSHIAIINHFQTVIDTQFPYGRPQLTSISKLKNGNIRIHDLTQDETQLLKIMKWRELYEGLEKYESMNEIVIHGVPKAEIDS